MNERAVRKFDSGDSQVCHWCHEEIRPSEPQAVYGTGNSIEYVRTYHKSCDEVRRAGAKVSGQEWLDWITR